MRAAAAANALSGRGHESLSSLFVADRSNTAADSIGNRNHSKGDYDNSDNDSVASSSADGGSEAGSLNSSRMQTDDGDYSVGDAAPPLDPNRKISPLHRDILNALSTSAFLSPINVDVRNESYWYKSRARLGPRKQNATIVKLNPKTLFYEAYMYKMKVRARYLSV